MTRRQISGRDVGGAYRTRRIVRERAWKRRQANLDAGRCINENKAGTHGEATHGVRCRACDHTYQGTK